MRFSVRHAALVRSHTVGSVIKALVGVVAFTAWGLSGIVPSSTAAGVLGDVAILLFVLDAFSIVVTDARSFPSPGRPALVPQTGLDPRLVHSEPRSSQGQGPGERSTEQICCGRALEPCACIG